jgi:hypothetical protein
MISCQQAFRQEGARSAASYALLSTHSAGSS